MASDRELVEAMHPGTLRLSDGSTIMYQPLAAFRCVYCKQVAVAARLPDGGAVLMHGKPECTEFTALSPEEFLRANRKKFEQDIAAGKTLPS